MKATKQIQRDADRSRNGDDSHDSEGDRRRRMPVARECTYTDYLKCQPMNFKGTEGVFGNALTWWNSHIRTVGHDVAYAMPWKTLKKMITDKYYSRGKIKKLEIEMWNLKVKGTDVLSYNQRFVGIKRLRDDLEVTATKVCVTAAKLKLVLFINSNEKYAK
ncbi:reverse transcriptase domain-containing protein [Tanacetum coccineum]